MIYTTKEADFSHVADYGMECLPGIVAVEMCPRPKDVSGIVLPEDVRSEFRSDLGIVIGSGVDELEIGDQVYVRHDRGKCIEGFGIHEPQSRSDVRFYGINGGFDFNFTGLRTSCHRYPFWEAVLCMSDFRPLGKNVLVKLAPKPEKLGVLLVNKRDVQRDPVAEVLAVGPRCEYVSVGDKVVIHEGAIDGETMFLLDDEGMKDCALISEEFLYARAR